MASVLALLSSLMWGSADFLGGSLTRRLRAPVVYGLSQVVGLTVLVGAATLTGAWAEPAGYWPWAIGSGLLGIVGMVTFYQALARGPMGIVSPLVSLSVIVPLVFGLLIGELPAPVQAGGIVLAVIGIGLASGPELSGQGSARTLGLAAVASVCFGGMFVLMAEGSQVSALMTMTGMRITSVSVLAVAWLVTRHSLGVSRADRAPIIAIGVMDAAANVLFGVATTTGLLITVSVLGSLYPVVTALLAAAIWHERLRPVQYAGVVLALGGVVLISAGGAS